MTCRLEDGWCRACLRPEQTHHGKSCCAIRDTVAQLRSSQFSFKTLPSHPLSVFRMVSLAAVAFGLDKARVYVGQSSNCLADRTTIARLPPWAESVVMRRRVPTSSECHARRSRLKSFAPRRIQGTITPGQILAVSSSNDWSFTREPSFSSAPINLYDCLYACCRPNGDCKRTICAKSFCESLLIIIC